MSSTSTPIPPIPDDMVPSAQDEETTPTADEEREAAVAARDAADGELSAVDIEATIEG